jgi:hypothetical protein
VGSPFRYHVWKYGVARALLLSLNVIRHTSKSKRNNDAADRNFAGLVLATQEGQQIAACLGNKKAALLGNHGLLTVGSTIEATVAWFALLEKVCQVQLMADASSAGSGKPLISIREEEAQSTWEAIGKADSGYFMGLPLFQVAEREFGERTYLGRGMRPI